MSNDFDDTPPPAKLPAPALSRRSTLEYFNPANAGGWLRRTIGSREKAYEGLKTLAWVIPLTILIWIYAERQQLLQNPAVVQGISLVPHSDDQSLSVQFTDLGPHTVTLKLMGPQEGVRKAVDLLTQRIPHEALTLDVGSARSTGDNQLVNVADRIQNLAIFKNNGVSVLQVDPPNASVNIDKLVHRQVQVQLPPDRKDLTTTGFNPATVDVSGPESVIKSQGNELKAYVKLDGYPQLKLPGEHKLEAVPVELSAPDRLRVDPNHVDGTITVNQMDETYEIPDPVYVWIKAQPSTLNTWSIKLADSDSNIAHVTVQGPKDQIDRIKNKTFLPDASLQISEEDIIKAQPIEPKFNLPPGVIVTSAQSKTPIKFTATGK